MLYTAEIKMRKHGAKRQESSWHRRWHIFKQKQLAHQAGAYSSDCNERSELLISTGTLFATHDGLSRQGIGCPVHAAHGVRAYVCCTSNIVILLTQLYSKETWPVAVREQFVREVESSWVSHGGMKPLGMVPPWKIRKSGDAIRQSDRLQPTTA